MNAPRRIKILVCVLALFLGVVLVSPWLMPGAVETFSVSRWYAAYALYSGKAVEKLEDVSYESRAGRNLISALLASSNTTHHSMGLRFLVSHPYPDFTDFKRVVNIYVELRPYDTEFIFARRIIAANPELLLRTCISMKQQGSLNPFILDKLRDWLPAAIQSYQKNPSFFGSDIRAGEIEALEDYLRQWNISFENGSAGLWPATPLFPPSPRPIRRSALLSPFAPHIQAACG